MGKQVTYQGVKMHEGWPRRIEESQQVLVYTERGIKYPRIRYGEDDPRWGEIPCNGCGVLKGQFHVVVGPCEYEKCPKCGAFFSEGHKCDFDELRNPSDAEADKRAMSLKATLLRWLGLVIFIVGVWALLSLAP